MNHPSIYANHHTTLPHVKCVYIIVRTSMMDCAAIVTAFIPEAHTLLVVVVTYTKLVDTGIACLIMSTVVCHLVDTAVSGLPVSLLVFVGNMHTYTPC